ncbi:MAG: tat pathway signal sequence [Gordonia sp. (in: high G+C Gram-positive bacteria)]
MHLRRRLQLAWLCAVVTISAVVTAHAGPAEASTRDNEIAANLSARLASAQAYAASRPGTVGIVVIDRRSGRVLANRYADTLVWTASTIKLAVATDLLQRNDAGTITLSAANRADLHRMLNSSDDEATDRLWFAYAGNDHMRFNRDFAAFGMTHLVAERGFTRFYPYWGFQKDTPRDLARLVSYVLSRTTPAVRGVLVREMRGVAANQQWGIKSLPVALRPGNKNGWSDEQGGSVINSIGFAGTGERFVISIMNSLNGQGNQDDGRITVSEVARRLLG